MGEINNFGLLCMVRNAYDVFKISLGELLPDGHTVGLSLHECNLDCAATNLLKKDPIIWILMAKKI